MRSLSLPIALIAIVFLEVAEARTLLETTHGKCTRELITGADHYGNGRRDARAIKGISRFVQSLLVELR